jgi:hypothetical protein
VTAWKATTDAYGNTTCASQSRTCTNGTLSGTYPDTSCTPSGGGSGPVGGAGGSCFVAGTKVTMWDGTKKKIEDIVVGEYIQTYDEKIGEYTFSPVRATLHHEAKNEVLLTFTLSDGTTFTSNDIHPIYVNERNQYVKAGEIYKQFLKRNQMSLKSLKGTSAYIVEIERSEAFVPLYNLHVRTKDDLPSVDSQNGHNYFVEDIMVHNAKN